MTRLGSALRPERVQRGSRHRRALLVSAGISEIASIALFMTKPVRPVGLVVAIEAAGVSLLFVWSAFFPNHLLWVISLIDQTLTAANL